VGRSTISAVLKRHRIPPAPKGLGQACPVPLAQGPRHGPIERHDGLDGILHDYYRPAA
jgi:hypothetical protein